MYGNEVTDLLEGGQQAIGAWSGVAAAAIAQGAAEVAVASAAHMQQLLLAAESNKRRAATAMNERSSRAHSILTLRITHPLSSPPRPPSRLVIADLGGCERVMQVWRGWAVCGLLLAACCLLLAVCCLLFHLQSSLPLLQSGAINDAARLSEAIAINLGLLALQVRSPLVCAATHVLLL